jgi:hypothetical protein
MEAPPLADMQIRAKIGGRLPGLKSRARQTDEFLVALLRERFPERILGEPPGSN